MTLTTRTKTSTTISTIRTPRNVAIFGLGSNLGNREQTLRRAITGLEDLCGPLAVAPLYETSPISTVPQPDYLNTVAMAVLPTDEPPSLKAARALLDQLKELEQEAGRQHGVRFGPRPLDLDLLVFGELAHRDPVPPDTFSPDTIPPRWLSRPPPRLRQRRFVLAPLNDLVPLLEVPPDGAPVHRLLDDLGTSQKAVKYEVASWNERITPIHSGA